MYAIDLHQHLWPEPLLDRLRAACIAPYLRGWRLFTATEAPYDIRPEHHDVAARTATDVDREVGLACLSLSAPLGIESPPAVGGRAPASRLARRRRRPAGPLPRLGVGARPEPDLAELTALLARGFVGVQLPATSLARPGRLAARRRGAGDSRAGRQARARPPRSCGEPSRRPGWWAPVVGYVAQLQAAWWAWHALDGRAALPAT